MRSSYAVKFVILLMAASISACAAIAAQRKAHEEQKKAFAKRVDIAHIWVTAGVPAKNRKYEVLGQLKYTEPFSAEAINAARQKEKLKKLAYEKWPDSIDAVIKVKSDVSEDGSKVIVTATAIKYEISIDRAALHKMNEGMVASPN